MKKVLMVCLALAVLLIPITAFAATNDGSAPAIGTSSTEQPAVKPNPCPKIDTSKLTDAQKKDLEDQQAKMIALQKETINKMVSNGTITKEQGDQMIANIDNMEKIRQEKGIVPFPGMGMGKGKGGRGHGGGCGKGQPKDCPNNTVPSSVPAA